MGQLLRSSPPLGSHPHQKPGGHGVFMRRLMASLLASVLIGGIPGAGLGQEVVKVAGIDATRVVIAPPQTELARIIKKGLSSAYRDAAKDTRAYTQAQKLYFFYGARPF